jgi:UDP-N-acetyl-D-mannosaminuronate dehydrogenase
MNQLNKTKTLAIIGLGYVGLPLAIEFEKKYSDASESVLFHVQIIF